MGCVLYELLTGEPPFSGDPEEVLAHHLFDRPVAPSKYNPDIAADVDAIVLHALEKFPHDRYPSAAAMITDIDCVLKSNQARADATAVSAMASVVPAMELPYWPALTVLARAREVRRHRLTRSVSAVAAALLPVAGFGLLHLRGPGEMGGASAALALGGVVQPRVVESQTDEVVSSQATPPLSPVGVTVVGAGIGNRAGTVLLAGDAASMSLTSVVAMRSALETEHEDSLATMVIVATAGPQRLQPEPEGASAPEPNVSGPDRPTSEPPKPDAPKPDAPRPDAPRPDKPKPDAPKPDAPRPDKPKPDTPKPGKPANSNVDDPPTAP